ncbi:16S rRNA (guanine(966)-N(2))-methyltransferase RsmD [uncultured Mitsuokella sp.]|uniref:16S rRNA (guanine(966)-N(2))-methyltransferase RsmD n=1 Tax=uncultured Mitsuokella sp. TaxID=453120 RepID=UPI0025936894|nr:16S rRNA (guanine(966)-N(2))-methyltransferase RsmD [uncultured Mitsuokella sp.]
MRIITGSARGCRLKTPKGQATRPTSDRIKESLFNILGPKVYGRKVLDIFAGTGNLGLEALSRGAASACFVDQATAAMIRENAVHTRLQDKAAVHGCDVFAQLSRFAQGGESFDLIFCDPPYHKGLAWRALTFFDESTVLAHAGILVVEHGADENDMPELSELRCVLNRRYGRTTQLSFFQRKAYLKEIEEAEQ